MEDHPYAAMYRNTFQANEAGSMREALADDVVWNQIGGGSIVGADAVMESMAIVDDVEFELELHDVISNDSHMIALMNVKVGSGDDAFSYRTAEIYHMKDGKVTERWAFSDDTAAINSFFSQFG